MEFLEQAKRLKALKELLILFPNDKYIDNLFFEILNTIEIKENYYSPITHGKFKSFLVGHVIDWKCNSDYNYKNKIVENFFNFIPAELYNQKMYILNIGWTVRNVLENVLVDVINQEIKNIYIKNKKEIHLI